VPSSTLSRKQIQQLARLRIREAEALYSAQLYDGSVYLAGYAVELALKARICKVLRVPDYPLNVGSGFKTHNLEQLRTLAGLHNEITINKNKDLFDNWSKAVVWDPEHRYEAEGKYSKVEARMILDSIIAKPNGVLTWLSKRW
jgi:HEPN domain-containing protein